MHDLTSVAASRKPRSWFVALTATLLAAACTTTADVERRALVEALGRSPDEVLRELGSAPDADTADDRAHACRANVDARTQLRLLRYGLGSDDERVVFGAVIWNGGAQLAVPELRNAAAIVIPRLADPDCPVELDDASPLIGSVDIAEVAAVLPKCDPDDATLFLANLHRMVRADSVPALCELALATRGKLRRVAFDNAEIAARYSGEHTELLVATWLRIVGVTPDPERGGLPGVLTAALRRQLDAPPPRDVPTLDMNDPGPPRLPDVACMRWLIASRPTTADLPLLQRLVDVPNERLRHGALWALGSMDDAESLRILTATPVDPDRLDLDALSLLTARARRGDSGAFATLFGDSEESLACALAVAASPRRRAFAERLLEAPASEALDTISRVRWWTESDGFRCHIPPYDETAFTLLEELAATSDRVDTRVLRCLIASVPSCATKRLAEKLLARPAAEIFAPFTDEGPPADDGRVGLGYAGSWPFLEVTLPEAFRDRLREGLRSDMPTVRETCGTLLLQVATGDDVASLAAWIDRPRGADEPEVPDDAWRLLARSGGAAARELLQQRADAATDDDSREGFLRALAVALGMPLEQEWTIPIERLDAVADALRIGDAGLAFVRAMADSDEFEYAALQTGWHDPRVGELLLARRDSAPSIDPARADQLRALHFDDRAALAATMQLVHDGRYATHYGVDDRVKARAEPLASTVPFLIEELGTNCCRVACVEEVLTLLFRGEGHAYDAEFMEPAAARLRRLLLPKIDRLRWSRIANAYVIAGT